MFMSERQHVSEGLEAAASAIRRAPARFGKAPDP